MIYRCESLILFRLAQLVARLRYFEIEGWIRHSTSDVARNQARPLSHQKCIPVFPAFPNTRVPGTGVERGAGITTTTITTGGVGRRIHIMMMEEAGEMMQEEEVGAAGGGVTTRTMTGGHRNAAEDRVVGAVLT